MAASYPSSSKSFSVKVDGVDLVQAAHINEIQDEIKAIEDQLIATKLALLALAPSDGQVLTVVGTTPTWAAKAPDADKLDGKDSTEFATSTHNHDTAYLGLTATAADSNKLGNIAAANYYSTSSPVFTGVNQVTVTDVPLSADTDFNLTTLGLPSGMKAVMVWMDVIFSSAGITVAIKPGGSNENNLISPIATANTRMFTSGLCKIGNNGIRISNGGGWANVSSLKVYVVGYFK